MVIRIDEMLGGAKCRKILEENLTEAAKGSTPGQEVHLPQGQSLKQPELHWNS